MFRCSITMESICWSLRPFGNFIYLPLLSASFIKLYCSILWFICEVASHVRIYYICFSTNTQPNKSKSLNYFEHFVNGFGICRVFFFLVLIYGFGICYAVAMLKWPVSTGYEILWQIYWNSFILLLNFAVISVLHKSNVKMKTKRGKYY